MTTTDLPNVSVGDFAAQLLEGGGIRNDLQSESTAVANEPLREFNNLPESPDISDVEVPMDFVNSITGVKSPPKARKALIETATRKTNLEDKAKNIISQLSNLLTEAKEVINEMTTCGMISVNMAGPQKPAKKKVRKKNTESTFKSILSKIISDLDEDHKVKRKTR